MSGQAVGTAGTGAPIDSAAGAAGAAAAAGPELAGGPWRCALGIDVGGTSIKAVICGAGGERLSSLERPTPRSLAGLRREVARAARDLRGRIEAGRVRRPEGAAGAAGAVVRPQDLVGTVGVAVPGLVCEEEGIAVHSANLGWRDLPMRRHMEEELGAPVRLSHDVRAGAWAESRWGAGGPDCLYLAIGTGIAAVLMLHGSPAVESRWAGEVGQMVVPDPDAPGRTAPLESIASARAMGVRYASALPGGATTPEGQAIIAEGSLAVLRAMEAGDDRARSVWDTALDALAVLIASGVCLLGPVDVVVGGGLMRAGQERLLAPLRERVAAHLGVVPPARILPSAMGPWAQALGSAGRALEAGGGGAAGGGSAARRCRY